MVGIGLTLWLIPLALLALAFGWTNTFTQMGWFFTQAALLTFGGAYAVLPFVYQAAVVHFGWLTSAQMIDGLALGETTPGPLIMIVAFVGFVGNSASFFSGAFGALVATWFTFLPSFIFILAGGPLVEKTQNNLKLSAPLTGVTAAVVGVILNLALVFGYHVLWPNGFGGHFDWLSALISLGAAIALLRFNLNVVLVIAGCAAVGLVATVAGFQS